MSIINSVKYNIELTLVALAGSALLASWFSNIEPVVWTFIGIGIIIVLFNISKCLEAKNEEECDNIPWDIPLTLITIGSVSLILILFEEAKAIYIIISFTSLVIYISKQIDYLNKNKKLKKENKMLKKDKEKLIRKLNDAYDKKSLKS